MNPQFQQEDKFMITARSAECLRLDLNSRLQKKSQIKLLNAKIKALKNKCKALRQQSKTDREMLSNLINIKNQIQNKTNQGLQACKQVQNQLFRKQFEMIEIKSIGNNFMLLNGNSQGVVQNEQRNENDSETSNNQVRNRMVLDVSLEMSIQKEVNKICSVPTERSMTASLKSQGNQQQFFVRNKQFSKMTCEDSQDTVYRRANTISYSPSKIPTNLHKHSFKNNKIIQIQKWRKKQNKENVFTKYIYTVILTIVVTIIVFKII